MLCDCTKALNAVGVRCDLFGQLVVAHSNMPRFMLSQVLNLCNLLS